jgi:hypothetical protein
MNVPLVLVRYRFLFQRIKNLPQNIWQMKERMLMSNTILLGASLLPFAPFY